MSKRTKALRKENDEAARLLPQASHCALFQIEEHLRDVRVSDYERECVRRDVIQMLADAAARGDTPEDVLGADYRAFCAHVIDALPRPTLLRQFLRGLRSGLPLVLALYSARLLLDNLPKALSYRSDVGTLPSCMLERLYPAGDPWRIPVTLGDVLCWVFVLAACFALLALPQPDPDDPHPAACKVLGILLHLFIFAVLLALQLLLPRALFRIPLPAALALLAALFGVYWLLRTRLD